MPRVVFAKKEDFEAWIKDQAGTRPRHVMYITGRHEAVLAPRVSTSPRMFGYYDGSENEMSLLEQLSREIGVPVYRIKAFEWDAEKPPGVAPKY